MSASQNQVQPTTCQVEVQKYSSEVNVECDQLDWWRIHAAIYPNLARLAQQYLGFCASQVASEEIFSTSGNYMTKRRAAMKGPKLEYLVFLNKNDSD